MDISSFKSATKTEQENSSPSILRVTSHPSNPQRKIHKVPSFFRKISEEWSHFLVRVKQFVDLDLTDDELIESLFTTSDDDLLPKQIKAKGNNTLTPAETQFLLDYKKFCLLDKVAEKPKNMVVDDLTEKHISSAGGNQMLPSVSATLNSRGEQQETNGSPLQYTQTCDNVVESERATTKEITGETLWEQRRAQWLTPSSDMDTEEKRDARIAQSSLKHISKSLYTRIYRDFMEKCKPLKKGRAINLEDFIAIIDAGWTDQLRFERAASKLR